MSVIAHERVEKIKAGEDTTYWHTSVTDAAKAPSSGPLQVALTPPGVKKHGERTCRVDQCQSSALIDQLACAPPP